MHYIWSTKNREHIISNTLIPQLIGHFKEKYPAAGDIYVDTANGISDHFHLLVGQKPVMSPSKVANQIKGASSHWINSHDLLPQKFAWQEGFSVFTVSHSQINTVRRYIFNQQTHHKKLSFEEEIKKFLKANDIDFNIKDFAGD
jgi:REP element-mobilizing transposase RayT